jgi:hypothetical protein
VPNCSSQRAVHRRALAAHPTLAALPVPGGCKTLDHRRLPQSLAVPRARSYGWRRRRETPDIWSCLAPAVPHAGALSRDAVGVVVVAHARPRLEPNAGGQTPVERAAACRSSTLGPDATLGYVLTRTKTILGAELMLRFIRLHWSSTFPSIV